MASQWIPADAELWKAERYLDFLEARKSLLAEEVNRRMEQLLHDDLRWLEGTAPAAPAAVPADRPEGDEEIELDALNQWVRDRGFAEGDVAYDYADEDTGQQKAVLDLAWPDGLQAGLSQPVAVLLGEEAEALATASQGGFRCFASVQEFKHYVNSEMLREEAA